MKYLFLACGMAALFAACQNENEPKVVSDKPGTSGDYRIIIEGEETDAQPSRSSGTIQFVGGTASGAGLYDGTAEALVSATPDPGYEINYFYGGPDSEPKKYDYANGGASSFKVQIGGQDHLFHVGFKKKTGSLTINAGTGGKVSPSGQQEIQREVPFSIKAIPNSGYEFAGWTVNNGSVTIENANSTSTTATLNSASGTITANFKQNIVTIYAYSTEEILGDVDEFYLKVDQPLPFDVIFDYTTGYTEWDDRYDPPQEVNHEQSTTATLVSGKLESSHQTHNGGAYGGSMGVYTTLSFYINGEEINPSEQFTINGKKYIIKIVRI